MIFDVKAEPSELIPPPAWLQLKQLIIAQGALYGIRIQIKDDPVNVLEADTRYFQWVDQQFGRSGDPEK